MFNHSISEMQISFIHSLHFFCQFVWPRLWKLNKMNPLKIYCWMHDSIHSVCREQNQIFCQSDYRLERKKCTGNIKNCLLLALLFSYMAINVGIYLKGRKISLLVHDLLGFWQWFNNISYSLNSFGQKDYVKRTKKFPLHPFISPSLPTCLPAWNREWNKIE